MLMNYKKALTKLKFDAGLKSIAQVAEYPVKVAASSENP